MKNITRIILPLCILVYTSCSNNSDSKQHNDTSYNNTPVGPAPDNNNATNPSMPGNDTLPADSTHQ